MSRDPTLYLEDILEAGERIRRYTQGLDQEKFVSDAMCQNAVVRNLEVIGEAAR